MSHCFKDREDAARFVSGRIRRLQRDSALTMTIKVDALGDCSVDTVTDLLSVGTLMPSYSNGPQNT